MGNTDGYKREGVQKVRVRRFETYKIIKSSVVHGQNRHIRKLRNFDSGQLELDGGAVRGMPKKTEKTQRIRDKEEEEEEEMTGGKAEKTTEEEEEKENEE